MKKSIFCILIILIVSLSLSAVSAENDTLGISEDTVLQDSDNLEATSGADIDTELYIIDDSAELVLWGAKQTNYGPEVSKNVELIIGAFEPNGYRTYLTAGSYNYESASINWKIGDLAPGQSEYFYCVSPKDIGYIFTFAYTDTFDPDEKNNYEVIVYPEDKVSASPQGETSTNSEPFDADLVSDVRLVNDGGPTFYCHASVTNEGSITAKNVVAYVAVPDIAFTSYTRKGTFHKDPNLNSYVWNIGDLEPGEKAIFYLDIAKPPAGSSYYVFSTVECDNAERNYENNFDWIIYTYKTSLTQSNPVSDTNQSTSNESSYTIVSNEASAATETLPEAGNPLIMALLSLMTIGAIGLKRKT